MEIPYSTCPVAVMSVVHEMFALVVRTLLDVTEVIVAGVLTKIGMISVENSWRFDTVATLAPTGFDFTRK